MTRHFYFILFIAIILSLNSTAQQNWGGGIDDEPYHFGFTFQYVSSDFKVLKKENWRDPFLDPMDQSLVKGFLYNISAPVSPGFGLGLVTDLRVGTHADIRFTPALVFSDRLVDYHYVADVEDRDPANYTQRKIQATVIDFPLGIKIKSDRRKNFRAYLIGGAKYSLDIVSKKKTDDAILILQEKFLKNNKNIWWYEVGVGFDLYLEYFKLSPELKLSNSFKSVLKPENNPYSAPIDKLFLRNLQFSLYFE
ncbi:MAG: PorT family protein [Daejeonella sp.]